MAQVNAETFAKIVLIRFAIAGEREALFWEAAIAGLLKSGEQAGAGEKRGGPAQRS